MSASCVTTENGLVAYHAYTLLAAFKLSNGVKLIKMRNPWGKETYTGPYCDTCSDWTPEL